MTWSRQQYEDRIRAHLGDLDVIQHVGETRIPLALETALATFTKDKPRVAAGTLDGDGTAQTFDLPTLLAADGWVDGWSTVLSIEYPTGNLPKTYVDYNATAIEDGTLYFADTPAAGTNNIRIRFNAAWAFPDDDPSDDTSLIPEVYAHAIAAKAAAQITRGIANEYAREQSNSVAGNLFTRDPSGLFEAARELEKQYKDTVLGRPTESGSATQVAMATLDVDVFPASVFHRREEYIDEEAYGG